MSPIFSQFQTLPLKTVLSGIAGQSAEMAVTAETPDLGPGRTRRAATADLHIMTRHKTTQLTTVQTAVVFILAQTALQHLLTAQSQTALLMAV
jgi:hypothetical protein